MDKLKLWAGENDHTVAAVLKRSGYSSSYRRRVKRCGIIFIDDIEASYIKRLCPGQKIEVEFVPEKGVEPQEGDLKIVYEDRYILIVDKPRGVLVHPTTKERTGTLANIIAYHLGGEQPIHLVSRLDKNTSGLLIAAKDAHVKYKMSKTIVKKCYVALLAFCPPADMGMIDLNIGRKEGSIIERAISMSGKPSRTVYNVLQKFTDGRCLAEFELKTGRTHQIRVHAAFLGCPLYGDWLYSDKSDEKGYLLRANKVSFVHPMTGEFIDVKIGMAYDFDKIYGIIDL